MIELPENIAGSKSFTSAQLLQLASVDAMPIVDPSFEDDRLKNIFQYYSLTPDEMDEELHRYAAELLEDKKVYEAWQVILSANML